MRVLAHESFVNAITWMPDSAIAWSPNNALLASGGDRVVTQQRTTRSPNSALLASSGDGNSVNAITWMPASWCKCSRTTKNNLYYYPNLWETIKASSDYKYGNTLSLKILKATADCTT